MHVLVAHSRPKGKYGRYVFTIMIHFSEPTETAEIAVIRPQTQTETRTVYSCDYCGRWHTIKTQFTTTTYQSLSKSEHRREGRLELYRYDNVEPDDIIELTLRDSELLKYQWTNVKIGWDTVALKNYWRDPKLDEKWDAIIQTRDYEQYKEQKKLNPNAFSWELPKLPKLTQHDRRNTLKEPPMGNEVIYEVTLLAWDEYMQSRTGEMHVEEELIQKTMNAEKITVKELLIEPKGEPLEIAGQKQFIEGELRYLT